MKGIATTIAAIVLLAAAPGAAAQEGSAFGPLAPSTPPEEQPQPVPQQTQPVPQPPVQRADDSLSAHETLPLLGMSLLLFVAIGVAIGRDARQATRRPKKTLSRRSSRANRPRIRSAHR
jgi:hypothetical protein